MTKTIQEIQKENRKFILEAIHGCSYEEIAQKDNIDITEKPITLDRLLLALPHELIEIELGFKIGVFGLKLLIKYHFFGFRKIYWRLEKKNIPLTLEEQTKEIQREFNKLLNAVKIYQQ